MSWRNGPTACKRAHTPHTEHRLDALEAWADHRIASRAGPSRAVAVATHCKSLACGGYSAARDLLHAPARLASVRRSSAPAAMATQHTTAQTTTQPRMRLGWWGSQVGECVQALAWVSVAQCCVAGMFRVPSGPRSRRSSIASHQRSHTPHYSPMLRPRQISWRCAAPSS